MDSKKKKNPGIPSAYFCGKIMLFGEYAVLKGSEALAIPFKKKSGFLKYACLSGGPSSGAMQSQQNLIPFLSYLQENKKNLRNTRADGLENLRNDLISGLFFESEIPENYGVGSSGALVAALYDTYLKKELGIDLENDLHNLSLMESFFHINSSGTDPLTSLSKQSIHIVANQAKLADFDATTDLSHIRIHLFDSLSNSPTKKGMEQNIPINDSYIGLNNNIIQSIMKHPDNLAFSQVLDFCKIHQGVFGELFTQNAKELAELGQANKEFGLKLCGSGGGGYYILFSDKNKRFPRTLSKWSDQLIQIS